MSIVTYNTSMRRKDGFTLLELMISTALLTIIGALAWVATQSSVSATRVVEAQRSVQACVRDAIGAMESELELAARETDAALEIEALEVVEPGEVVFQIPTDDTGQNWSGPITYVFVTEDTPIGDTPGNGRLDEDEDADGDGSLTRRVVRIEGDNERSVGAANDLSEVSFSITPDNRVLTIMATATKLVGGGRDELVSATATTRVVLMN